MSSLANTTPSQPRKLPTQQRSRERVERILSVATVLIAARGSDAVKMSEVAEGAGVSIGSLYQYFPDKAAIVRTLAERYNELGLDCVRGYLTDVQTLDELAPTMERVVDEFYAMFEQYPVTRDIWSATQVDKSLRDIEAEDNAAHAALLEDALRRLGVGSDKEIVAYSALITHLLAATVRLAITLPPTEARAMLDGFKAMMTRDFTARFASAS